MNTFFKMDDCIINLNNYQYRDVPKTSFFKNNTALFDKTMEYFEGYTKINYNNLIILSNKLRIDTNLTANALQNRLMQEFMFN